ncbi:hypothetical protein [Bacillus sp. KH172YL63]|uniref:hypothetical protein n=1 Tax=Bacillus sp. KH172YL63 TaxID=2709784 RepID=UPI0013E47760|nr:hypothetical protein [Bacillus sp. KH172YL63]BCB05207.1 hypothetical protein KH172YL63_33400 [Bacillus sp. KH172YL63]
MSELTSIEKLLLNTTPGTLMNRLIINGSAVEIRNFISFNSTDRVAIFTPTTAPEYLVVNSQSIEAIIYCQPEPNQDHG